MAFDAHDSVLIVTNNDETPPFATLINVAANCQLTLSTKVIFSNATNGVGQAVWNPVNDRPYQSIPSISGTTAAPGNTCTIARINPLSGVIETEFSLLDCMPVGLALGPDQTFLAGCSVVYDTNFDPWFGADTNSANPQQAIIDVQGNVTFGTGIIGLSDEVWYNPGDRHWHTGSQNSPYSPHPVPELTAGYRPPTRELAFSE